MKTIKREVKSYIVELMCDCGGIMNKTGNILLPYPAKFKYKCEECQKMETTSGNYPKTVNKYVGKSEVKLYEGEQ